MWLSIFVFLVLFFCLCEKLYPSFWTSPTSSIVFVGKEIARLTQRLQILSAWCEHPSFKLFTIKRWILLYVWIDSIHSIFEHFLKSRTKPFSAGISKQTKFCCSAHVLYTYYNRKWFDRKELKIKIEAVKINLSCYLWSSPCVCVYTCRLSELATRTRCFGSHSTTFSWVRLFT